MHTENNHLNSSKDALWYVQCILFGGLILYFGRTLFVPVSFAILISFVLYPVCQWLESKGVMRMGAIALALLLLLVLGIGVALLLATQVVAFSRELPSIQIKFDQAVVSVSQTLVDVFGVSMEKQKVLLTDISRQSASDLLSLVGETLVISASSLVLIILIPVYVVLILYYRRYWMKVLGGIFPHENHKDLHRIITLSIESYHRFIKGMLIVYVIVAALNTIGLALLGIPHAILFGCIASILTIVPYVGIIVGSLLPIAMAWITYDSAWYPLGIVGIFTFVQYLEANVIFPIAVSSRLNVNTLVMLLVIFSGGIIWGVAGMILFVPFVGIVKLIADQNPRWKAISMVVGTERSSGIIP
jgi:predicted PurR-regulated permease PerM